MRTQFSETQLSDPDLLRADRTLRNCVHCGFCLSTCPTYALLGDERDSPRGRIYLIQDMLERGGPPQPETVHHIDRCLSCLGCVTACPSGVDYMHLVDYARSYIETHYQRPWVDRWMRRMLSFVLPRPSLFHFLMLVAYLIKSSHFPLPARLRRLLDAVPAKLERRAQVNKPQTICAEGIRSKTVLLLTGCVQQVLGGHINEATVRILRRFGCDVIIAEGAGCCGAVPHHMGQDAETRDLAIANLIAWNKKIITKDIDAIVVNASGCGTMIKDYGHIFSSDSEWAEVAKRVSDLTVDISEFLSTLGVQDNILQVTAPVIAYHDSCSLQHGQGLSTLPRLLLKQSGFEVIEIADSHMCCGSAGTYNLLQPELADALGRRKGANVIDTGASAIAAGNLGCLIQLEKFSGLPAVHTVELIDWATGGPKPERLK